MNLTVFFRFNELSLSQIKRKICILPRLGTSFSVQVTDLSQVRLVTIKISHCELHNFVSPGSSLTGLIFTRLIRARNNCSSEKLSRRNFPSKYFIKVFVKAVLLQLRVSTLTIPAGFVQSFQNVRPLFESEWLRLG